MSSGALLRGSLAARSAASGALRRSVDAVRSGARLEAAHALREVADDVIEADAAEPRRRLVLVSRVGDDDDRVLAVEDRARPTSRTARRARC